jgi:hypothetical protein
MSTYEAAPTLNAYASSTFNGFKVQANGNGVIWATKYIGDEKIPQDIKRRRRQVYDAMRRLGTPVLVKHRYNFDDVKNGGVKKASSWDDVYATQRNEDPIGHGVGLVSVETAKNEWVSPEGEIVYETSSPGSLYVEAPKYRGYGPGYLVYIIEPDAAQDFFKLTESGAMYKTQTATAQAPWFPTFADNDLLVNVTIDSRGDILDATERFELKNVQPVSIRGLDRKGLREHGNSYGPNRYMINQTFEMAKVPDNNVLYQVETDR